jgi:hypothetical protein
VIWRAAALAAARRSGLRHGHRKAKRPLCTFGKPRSHPSSQAFWWARHDEWPWALRWASTSINKL